VAHLALHVEKLGSVRGQGGSSGGKREKDGGDGKTGHGLSWEIRNHGAELAMLKLQTKAGFTTASKQR
jgi:hypothetical protein